jgi:hypothetical protein
LSGLNDGQTFPKLLLSLRCLCRPEFLRLGCSEQGTMTPKYWGACNPY